MIKKDEILKQIKLAGWRLTQVRIQLVDLFCRIVTPLSVNQIVKKIPDCHKVTIYRELDFLASQHIINPVYFGNRTKFYELALRRHHHHLICQKCNQIENFELGLLLEKQVCQIQKENKFKITSHSLEFFGLCNNCK